MLNWNAARDEEIKHQRRSGLTLRDIGKRHGLSHERIRQIVGNTGYLVTDIKHRLILEEPREKSNATVAKDYDLGEAYVAILRREVNPVMDRPRTGQGAERKAWLKAKLEALGYACEYVPRGTDHNMVINGHRVLVSACNWSGYPPSYKGKAPLRRFRVGNKDIDYAACIVGEDVFVIPGDVITTRCDDIVFCWPSDIGWSKYRQYLNRVDLLE